MLVSVSIREVAILAGKNQRTIRRWCQLGHVAGARCSPGGHWRVRVSILKKDRLRARALARRSKDFAGEIAGIVMEKAQAALRPPAGFERMKKPSTESLARFYAEIEAESTFTISPPGLAEKIAAAREFAEVIGEPDTDLSGRRLAVARRRGLILPKGSAGDEPLPEVYATAGRAAGLAPEMTALQSAVRNLARESKRVSIGMVCSRLGWSRATLYRHGRAGEIKALIADFEESARKAAGGEAMRLAGVAETRTDASKRKTRVNYDKAFSP